MKCQKCGNEVANGTAFCPACGTAVTAAQNGGIPAEEMSTKNFTTYALLGFFLGNLGVHDFYAGYSGRAIVNIIGNVIISPFLVQVSTGIELLTNKKDGNGKFFQGDRKISIILGSVLIALNLIVGFIVIAAILGLSVI